MMVFEIIDNEPLVIRLARQQMEKGHFIFIFDPDLMIPGEPERVLSIKNENGGATLDIKSPHSLDIRSITYDDEWLEGTDFKKRSADSWLIDGSEQVSEGYSEDASGKRRYDAEDGDPLAYVLCKRILNDDDEITYINKYGRLGDLKGLQIEDGQIELHYLEQKTNTVFSRVDYVSIEYFEKLTLEKVRPNSWKLYAP